MKIALKILKWIAGALLGLIIVIGFCCFYISNCSVDTIVSALAGHFGSIFQSFIHCFIMIGTRSRWESY